MLDGLGRRVAKKVDGQLRFGLLYGEAVGPSAQLEADGSVRSRFVYGTRSTVPDYMLRDGHRYRIVADDLGSPRLVVDVDSGEVAQRLDCDAFGRVVRDTNPGFQPFGFAGGLYDPDTGLVRFGARDYDPETGRWTAQDPIDFAAGDANLYGYVLGDPVNLVDPSGLVVDTAVDAGFVVYDIITIGLGCGSWSSLALDTGSLFVPFVAGLGHTDDLYRTTKAWSETERTLVIGRTKDLTAPGALRDNEYTLLDRLTPDLGSPKANWKRNSSVLRQELRNGVTRIRDASPGDSSGFFLNAERNLLENRGWLFDSQTSHWGGP